MSNLGRKYKFMKIDKSTARNIIWILLILVAVLVGGSLAGVVGMLFSVPLCSIIYTLLKQSIDRRLKIIIE